MPTADQILNGLREIANTWKIISILWHVYFGALVLALTFGIRPSRRIAGLVLGLPFLSVGSFAWLSCNPFNGIAFTAVGIVLLLASLKLPHESVQIAPKCFQIPGVLLFASGWIYPHFLDTSSYVPYLYAAPIGIIPCPTLIVVIGFALILDNLGSRTLSMILGGVGLLYGIMGIVYLHIALDGVLILGAVMVLIYAITRRWNPSMRELIAGS